MSRGYSASPSSQQPGPAQQPGLHAEQSFASVGTPARQPHVASTQPKTARTPAYHPSQSSSQSPQADHGFSVLFRGSPAEAKPAAFEAAMHWARDRGPQAEPRSANAEGSGPPGQGCTETHAGDGLHGSGLGQPHSPRAPTGSQVPMDPETPKSLQLKAMTAQTERLQQVQSIPIPEQLQSWQVQDAVTVYHHVLYTESQICTMTTAPVRIQPYIWGQG